MLFDWDQYKELADFLRLRDDEASKRSAISHLYYAVYSKARLLCEKEDPNFRVPPDNSHTMVWRKFLNQGHTKRTIYNYGLRLRDFRINADYDVEIVRIDDVVETAFQTAEQLIKTLNKLSGNK